MESGAPTSRAVRPYNAKVHEEQFQREVGCPDNISNSEIFPFLCSLPDATVIKAQTAVFDKCNPSLRWPFQPVIDGDIISRKPLEAWKSKLWYKIPIMTGFNNNEGSLYVDKKMSQSSQFRAFWRTFLPELSPSDLDTIERLYPDPNIDYTSPYTETKEGLGSQYSRIEAAYGHYAYVAPVRQTAHFASSQGSPVYLYHWAFPRITLGASHADNMYYETYNKSITDISEFQRELSGTLHAYLTSFITTGDPNALRHRYPHRPPWSPFKPDKAKAMIFGDGNDESMGVPWALLPDLWKMTGHGQKQSSGGQRLIFRN